MWQSHQRKDGGGNLGSVWTPTQECASVMNEPLERARFHTPVTCEGAGSDSEGPGWGLGARVSHTHPAVGSIAKP